MLYVLQYNLNEYSRKEKENVLQREKEKSDSLAQLSQDRRDSLSEKKNSENVKNIVASFGEGLAKFGL